MTLGPRRFTGPPTSKKRTAGFTLTEVMVSLGATVMVVGALLVGAISIRRGLHGNQVYTEAYSDQRRITDYISRDLRRAVAVAYTDESGTRKTVTETAAPVTIEDRATVILTLPGYYRSENKKEASYDEALDVVASEERLDYGSETRLAPTVEVTFRKIFTAQDGSTCFVRREGDTEEVIVRNAQDIFVQLELDPRGQATNIKTWFRSQQTGPTPLVSTHDQVLLRNPSLEYRP